MVIQLKYSRDEPLYHSRRIHDGTKPVFRCPRCPAKYGRKMDVDAHVAKMHRQLETPAKCDKCQKDDFMDLYSLKVL